MFSKFSASLSQFSKFIQFNNHPINMLTYKYIHVQFHAKEKKEKKNTAESKNEKKIAEEQVIFSSYKADSFQRL